MSRTTLRLGALIVVGVLLHGAVMPHVAIFGGRINVLVLFVAGTAFLHGTTTGMLVGLVAGLLADALFTSVFGLSTIPLVVVGYAVGQAERQLFHDEVLVPAIVGFASVLTFEVLLLLLSRLAFGVWWGGAFVEGFVPSVLVTGALMPLAFFGLLRLDRVLGRR